MSAAINKRYKDTPNRWQLWNYSAPAKYFITVCTQNMEMLFGNIVNKTMKLSDAGKCVSDEIEKLPTYHPRVILDENIVMPNHIHMIIELGDYFFNNEIAGQIHEFDQRDIDNHEYNKIIDAINAAGCLANKDVLKQYRKLRRRMLIPMIIGKLKMQTSKQINILNKTPQNKNWQIDYYDHIIRDDQSYWNIKNYIKNNPARWNEDKFHG
ncbi:MAG TPA: hypothetical protein PKW80_13495 [Bacteroidales bacterium]|nr:hypothetical protein [Bacteroidales bacterium]